MEVVWLNKRNSPDSWYASKYYMYDMSWKFIGHLTPIEIAKIANVGVENIRSGIDKTLIAGHFHIVSKEHKKEKYLDITADTNKMMKLFINRKEASEESEIVSVCWEALEHLEQMYARLASAENK